MKVSEFIERLEQYNQDYEVVFIVPKNIDFISTNCLDVQVNREEKQVNIIHTD